MDRLIFISIIFCLFFPLGAGAATLYLEPAEADYYQGDTFIVQARIDVKDECINTIEANLIFSKNILEAIDFSSGNSILTLWVNPPSINQEAGLISFSGGIPGGYCGYLPGDPGESNLLGKLIFSVKPGLNESKKAEVEFLNTSQVLLNDGFGTLAELKIKGTVFIVLSGIPTIPKEEWQEELVQDKIPPEDFKIVIERSEAIFEGKYFITFSTVDKQTGIDYYEIKEGRGKWQKAQSPFLLENQDLRSIIKVKAVDKAGNERIAEYTPQREFSWLIIILILIGAGIIWWIIRKLKTKVKNEKY